MWTQICADIQSCQSGYAYGQNKIYEMSEVQQKVLAEKSVDQGIIKAESVQMFSDDVVIFR